MDQKVEHPVLTENQGFLALLNITTQHVKKYFRILRHAYQSINMNT